MDSKKKNANTCPDCGGDELEIEDVEGSIFLRKRTKHTKVACLQRQLATLKEWQEQAMHYLPPCGTVCQCQGEDDCGLKQLKREANANAIASKTVRDHIIESETRLAAKLAES